MTIGQRIAQKRKELGLSQEGLGDRLGVSRQSIYKWESGTALPEIDKLVALSKLFGVSVGWLLGVEDAPSAPPENSELTEAQLQMVEEIVSRYLTAQPKPMSQKRRLLFKTAMAAAAVCLVLVLWCLFERLDRVDGQYVSLQSSVNNVTDSVNRQIDGISDRVEEILMSQNGLTADHSTEIVATDYAQNTVTFSFRAISKTFSENMTAWLEVQNEEGSVRFGPYAPQGQTFAGEVTAALTDDIRLYIVFETGGSREMQLLDTYSGLYSDSIPQVNLQTNFMWGALPEDSTLVLEEASVGRYLYTPRSYHSAPAQIRAGLFKNQKLAAWAEPCAVPSSFRGFSPHDYNFFRLPDLAVPLTAGDELCLAAVVTDQYGRVFVETGDTYALDEAGTWLVLGNTHVISSADEWQLD